MNESKIINKKPESSLGQKAARGASVIVLGQVCKIVIQFGGIVLLARLLSPHDYGLIAMVTTIIGVAEVLRDFGLSSAAVQAKNISRQQRDNLFWWNTGIGLLLSIIIFISAKYIADLYGEPRLITISRWLAVSFLLNGMTTQYRASLNRELQFSKTAMSDIGSQFIALAAAVYIALLGFGYWALVAQQIIQATAILLIAAAYAKWLPRGYTRGAEMKSFLNFGWGLMGTQLLGYASRNIGQVIIGNKIGADALGMYNRAFQILMMPLNQINAPSTTVALPILAKLQDEPVRFNSFLLRGQTILVHVITAIFVFSIAQANPLITVILGAKWSAAIPIFQILGVGGIFQAVTHAAYWIFLAKGLTRDQLLYSIVGRAVGIVCILIGTFWGMTGVAIGFSFGLFILWPMSLIWLKKVAQMPAWAMFSNGLRAIIGYGISGGVSYYFTFIWKLTNAWEQILVGGLVMLFSIAIMFIIWPAFRKDIISIFDVKRLIIKKVKKN